MPDERNSEEPSTQERVEETLDEDLSVQGTEPDDRQDAAVALGTEPPAPEEDAFVGGGEVDWASLQRDRSQGSE